MKNQNERTQRLWRSIILCAVAEKILFTEPHFIIGIFMELGMIYPALKLKDRLQGRTTK